MGTRSTPRTSPISGESPAIGPPTWPEKTLPSASAWPSSAEASTYSATCQPPSAITRGPAMKTATLRSETSTSSTLPLSTWNAKVTWQRSWSAGAVRPEVVQGHTTSQLQLSRYVPFRFQGMTLPACSAAPGVKGCVERVRSVPVPLSIQAIPHDPHRADPLSVHPTGLVRLRGDTRDLPHPSRSGARTALALVWLCSVG